jgi:SET domain-containing protein
MIVIPVTVRKSRIRGRGVFAARRIVKGTVVVRSGSTERHYTREQYKAFSRSYKRILDKFGYWENGVLVYPTDATKYLNHSCEPNLINLGSVDIAARTIRKGEELTYDYKVLLSPGQSFNCHCGSKNCKGTVRA